MIRAERDKDNIIHNEVRGDGEQILAEFAGICANLVNIMIEKGSVNEKEATTVLSVTMARGISERNRAEKVN